MIRLLQFLWSGCWHRWKAIRSIKTRHSYDGHYSHTTDDYVLQCERCGNVKRRNLKP